MNRPSKPPITSPEPPLPRPPWIVQLPASVFPFGPRSLYYYLCAFDPGTCLLSNSRLARELNVSIATIRRWRSWLTTNHLIYTRGLHPNHREINCHHFNTASEWHSAQALTNISRKGSS